jgi:NMD protein affecting ribosome stability and mRNA decay
MTQKSRFSGFHPIRRDRLIQNRFHDAYKIKGKLAEPTVCPECGAVFHEGRWQWLPRPPQAHEEICPACHRVHDEYPAGFVTLGGAFLHTHREEILHLVRNHEARERGEHPLQRLMDITDEEDGILVTTTDIHLARGIGEAVHDAYEGELEYHYNAEENLLRVHWQR